MIEKDKPSFWRSIEVGSTITLGDIQALQESKDSGEGFINRDHVVKRVRTIKGNENIAEWLLFELDGSDDVLWLMIKIVGECMDMRIYFEPPDFSTGNRKDMIENEMFWLFQEPEDTEDIDLDALAFTELINMAKDESDQDTEYAIKKFGTIYGESFDTCDSEPVLTAITEYSTDEDVDNPEIVLLELGGEDSGEGGFITLLVGTPISETEVDVLAV